jgi:hypothetical protein
VEHGSATERKIPEIKSTEKKGGEKMKGILKEQSGKEKCVLCAANHFGTKIMGPVSLCKHVSRHTT